MFEKCNWTKYLMNIPQGNYQINNTVRPVFIFSSCNYDIYFVIATRLFKKLLSQFLKGIDIRNFAQWLLPKFYTKYQKIRYSLQRPRTNPRPKLLYIKECLMIIKMAQKSNCFEEINKNPQRTPPFILEVCARDEAAFTC